jgi:hypothetical protein
VISVCHFDGRKQGNVSVCSKSAAHTRDNDVHNVYTYVLLAAYLWRIGDAIELRVNQGFLKTIFIFIQHISSVVTMKIIYEGKSL